MKVYPIPEKCLTGTLINFGRTATTERSLYREDFGDETLRSASHSGSYMIEGSSLLNFLAF
jgi:hypothetical protein